MTDPEFADATYIEPVTKESILSIIKRENRCHFANHGWTSGSKCSYGSL